jgi:hypothetical protein
VSIFDITLESNDSIDGAVGDVVVGATVAGATVVGATVVKAGVEYTTFDTPSSMFNIVTLMV